MSTRYVWSRNSVDKQISSTTYSWGKYTISETTTGGYVEEDSSITISGSTVVYIMSGGPNSSVINSDRASSITNSMKNHWVRIGSKYADPAYYVDSASGTSSGVRIYYSEKYTDEETTESRGSYVGTVTSTSSSAYPNDGSDGDYWYVYSGSTPTYAYSKGSTKYSDVSGSSKNSYPSNGKSGNYWYTLRGNDSIDPSAVSIPDAPQRGENANIAVKPGQNSYGGTITYLYQYSVDGGTTWIVIDSSTAVSVWVVVPDDAKTLQARVRASDNMGFTSADYVYSAIMEVTSRAVMFCAGGDGVNREVGTFANGVFGVNRATCGISAGINGVVISK